VSTCQCGIWHRVLKVASPLTASGSKGSLLLVFLFLIFLGLIYLKLFSGSPSIISRFEEETLRSNYQVFKQTIQHAHLHFQTKKSFGCDVDCWIKGSVGLDFSSSGYPVSARFTPTNHLFNLVNFEQELSDKDCADVWSFLMGPLHQSINSDASDYLAYYDLNSSICIYTAKKVANLSIIYSFKKGYVNLKENPSFNP